MAHEQASLSDAERDVLKVLWKHGPATARRVREQVQAEGRQWAHTTVLTLLDRLRTKEYVTVDKSGHAHVFSAAVDREEVLQEHLAELADNFCGGETSPLVLTLIQQGNLSQKEIERFRELIDELDRKHRRRSAKATRKGRTR